MLKEAKREKFVDEMIGSANAGIPGYFGIIPNERETGYELFTKKHGYVVMRLEVQIKDQYGQTYSFNEHSKDFCCCLRQGAEKWKRNAFLLLNPQGQYICSSKEEWVEADIYAMAIPAQLKSDSPAMPLVIWGRFHRHGEDDLKVKNRLAAVSSDYNVAWLLDALADSTFGPQKINEVTDDE